MSFSISSNTNGIDGPSWKLDRVFGRENESKVLCDLADQRSNEQRVVVLHGAAGSGKSTLIRSQPWQDKGWLLATGKFDQLRHGEPFSAVVHAVNKIVNAWVNQNNANQVCQMSAFREILNEHKEVLGHVLPQAYLAAMEEPGSSDQNNSLKVPKKHEKDSVITVKQDKGLIDCLNASIVRVLQFLCKTLNVVLFIDDIQWADASSLELIRVMACGTVGRVKNLIFAISYRDEEVDEEHSVTKLMREIKSLDEEIMQKVHMINVVNLDVEDVNCLVASICMQDTNETFPLSKVIHEKTAGNPFFVTQFLLMLRQENFLTYSFSSFKWEWGDVDKLASAAHVSENVADVVGNSLKLMPNSTRVAVEVAACLGSVVPASVLIEYFEREGNGNEQAIEPCKVKDVQMQGLQNLLHDAVKRGILLHPDGQDAYMWAHDKLQQTAYMLIPDEVRCTIHKGLGKLLWEMSKMHPEEEWMVFMAAEQYKRYSSAKNKEILGADVAALCMEAAQLSMSKSALMPAFDLLRTGQKHLSVDEKWTTHYVLSVRLLSTVAELAFQLGKIDEALEAVKDVETNAKSYEDKFRVQCVMLECITSGTDRDYKTGIAKAIEILKEYGFKFPKRLVPGQVYAEKRKLRRKLQNGKLDSLLDLPEMTDINSLRIMKLLVSYVGVFLQFSQVDSDICFYTALRCVLFSAQKGLCEETAISIAWVGTFLRKKGLLKEADEYGELAMKVMKRYPLKIGSVLNHMLPMLGGTLFSATRPLNKILDLFLESHQVSLKTGSTERASSSIMAYTITYIAVGLPLGPLKSDLVQYATEARQFNVPQTIGAIFQILEQTIINLQEVVENPASLKGRVMDEDVMLEKLQGNGQRMTKRDIYTFRLFLAVIYGDMDTAEIMLEELESFQKDLFIVRAHVRRTAMALAALRLGHTTGKKKYRTLGTKLMKDFGSEAKTGNVNAHPIYTMLQAELHRSKEHYDNAIRSCSRLGLLHYSAYLSERAAEFFLKEKDVGWAEFYMAQSFAMYDEWGATGKSKQLEAKYPDLVGSSTLKGKARFSLKGRTRYSSSHSDLLRDMDWERMSGSMTLTTGSSHTLRTSKCTVKLDGLSDASTTYSGG